MDEIAVNKCFFIGFERTADVLKVTPEGDEGDAEIVGIFIACLNELSDRWNMTEREAMSRVATIIPKD